MTLKYLNHPKIVFRNQTTGDNLSDFLTNYKVVNRENAVSIASLTLDNDDHNILADIDTTDILELKIGETTTDNTMVFIGRLQYPTATYANNNNKALINCVHVGYGLCEMLVADAYGLQSAHNDLSTVKTILADVDNGVLPAYVDKIFNGAASGYLLDPDTYIDDHIADLTGTIRYREYPYTPADKVINDLIDISTALNSPDPGGHWMVDNLGFFRLKQLGTSQTAGAGSSAPDWLQWYNGTTNDNGQATLTLGDDVELIDYQEMPAEGNYIVNYGLYRNPGSGDAWTEDITDWYSDPHITLSKDETVFIANTASVRATINDPSGPRTWHYPDTYSNTGPAGAHWDITKMGSKTNIPTLNFSLLRHGFQIGTYGPMIKLFTDDAHNYRLFENASGILLPEADTWYNFNIPIGPYWRSSPKRANYTWETDGGGSDLDWSDVNCIYFDSYVVAVGDYTCIDGLYFGDFPICRVAWNSNLPTGLAKMRFINDMVATDDSLTASDDSGTMAQLVKAEYLRQSTATYCQTVKTPILPDALPGQQFSLNSVTYRATEIIHEGNGDDATTTLKLNSDLTNGRTRRRYDDLKKVYENFLPNDQNRQAASMKAGNVDYKVLRLVKDYAP